MPRKKNVPPEVIVNAIIKEKNNIIAQDGNIVPPSNEIWQQISKNLDYKYAPKSIYIFVKTNKNDILKSLGFETETKSQKRIREKSSESSSGTSQDDPTETSFKFNITLSPKEWADMRPVTAAYKCADGKRLCRNYRVFTPYRWTSIINEHFYMHTKLSCCLSFKRGKIYDTGYKYAVMQATCLSCSSKLLISLDNEPKEDSKVLLNCIYRGNFKECVSNIKRRQIGHLKDAALIAISKEQISCNEFRRQEARKKMNLWDKEPSDLPTANALRVLKTKTISKEKGYEDTVSIIHAMKYSNSILDDSIKRIGLEPFFVMYWIPSQIYVFRSYCKAGVSKICIDATGGLVKKLKKPNGGKSSVVFLYEATFHDEKRHLQFSVTNMISEKHDSNLISYWLAEWKKDVRVTPKEVVTDHSVALLSAVTKAFANMKDIYEYIDKCYEIIFNDTKSIALPNCYIRTDVAHTIKIITSWNALKHVGKRTKLFYVCALTQILMSKNIQDIENLFLDIFIVAFSETEGNNITTGSLTYCEISKDKIKKRVATGLSEDIQNSILNSITQDDTVILEETGITTNFTNWVKQIAQNAESMVKNDEGDHDNLQFLPAIVGEIINLAKKLPTWTAVMIPFFKFGSVTASSAPVESNFNDLKNRVFNHKKLPLPADEFLADHIKSLEGNLIISSSKMLQKTSNNEEKNSNKNKENNQSLIHKHVHLEKESYEKEKQTIIEDEFSEEVENWKGLALPPKKRKAKSYLNTHPEILQMNLSSSTESIPIGLLKNGNRYLALRAQNIKNTEIILTNTCAFDSLVQVLASAILDSPSYQSILKTNIEEEFFSLIEGISRKITPKCYRQRSNILLKISNVNILPNNIKQISCETTAKNLINKLINNEPSVTEISRCTKSGETYSHNRSVISLAIKPGEITDLELHIMENIQPTDSLCNSFHQNDVKCDEMKTITSIVKNHIFIELIDPELTSVETSEVVFQTYNTRLSNIPRLIFLQQRCYHLRGVISFSAPEKNVNINTIGHYKAICLRQNDQWEVYDDLKDFKYNISEQKLVGCEILLYTI